uniref:Uncharacterized protein n=1 Tax=Leptobrachium leishanense TaxID=445787 RepID=A0A8C5MUV7_9ANUR
MGDSSSKTRVSFEADENDNITVVKRIRLSDNVINRMREPSSPAPKPRTPPQSQYTPQPSPPLAKPLLVLPRAQNSLAPLAAEQKAATEEERLKAKSFAKKLEEKERELKRQDEFHMDQLARLEERSAQFYKKFEAHPICADLQAQILQCYQQNPQQSFIDAPRWPVTTCNVSEMPNRPCLEEEARLCRSSRPATLQFVPLEHL